MWRNFKVQGRFQNSESPISLPYVPLDLAEEGQSDRRIKFARKGEIAIQIYSLEDFEIAAGYKYISRLIFADETTFCRVKKQCASAFKHGGITSEMKWLGALHAEQIRKHSVADVSIRWIDESLGYGLFAETDLKAGEFIGEYVGLVRGRSLFFRNYNEYCFSYPTSDVSFRKHIIDARDYGNEVRYANHSEDPNCEARCIFADELLHIILRVIKDIPANTQITYDYSRSYWKERTPDPNAN